MRRTHACRNLWCARMDYHEDVRLSRVELCYLFQYFANLRQFFARKQHSVSHLFGLRQQQRICDTHKHAHTHSETATPDLKPKQKTQDDETPMYKVIAIYACLPCFGLHAERSPGACCDSRARTHVAYVWR
jgi:hypothetical protein